MKKRILSIMLLAVMILGVLASCEVVETTPTPTTSPTPEASTAPKDSATPTLTPTLTPSDSTEPLPTVLDGLEIPEKFEGLDFGKEEIGIIMSGKDIAIRSITLPEDENLTYSVNVAVYLRNQAVESLLNVDIVYKGTVGMQDMVSHMREYFASPDTSYDIVGVYQYFDLGLAFGEFSGSFYNYNAIEEKAMFIDPQADYWDTERYETLSHDGASFWITGDLSLTWLSSMFVSYVNADMWEKYEEEIEKITGVSGDIYQLVYDGKWTIDLWCDLNELVYINNDEDESKVSPADQHGFVGYSSASGINNIIVDGLFSGCHVTFSKIGSDGVPVMDYNNNALKAYVNATRELYNESKSCLVVYNGDMTAMDIFANGNSLMTVNTLAEAEYYLSDMKDDYYILPPPKANESQVSYATSVGDSTNQFGIPTKCQNVAAATATLEALGYFSYQIVTPVYYNVALRGALEQGNLKAVEMMDFIRGKIYSDFVLLWENSMDDNVSWYLRKNIGSSVISSEAVIKQTAWDKQLQKLLDELEY